MHQPAGTAAELAALLAEALHAQPRTIVAEAEQAAAGDHARAQRRLAEAEAGARAVREQVAEQVLGWLQREMYELRRAAKAEHEPVPWPRERRRAASRAAQGQQPPARSPPVRRSTAATPSGGTPSPTKSASCPPRSRR